MREISRNIVEIVFSADDGPLVDTFEGKYQITEIDYESATFSDSSEVLETVSVKGLKATKDGRRHAGATYEMPVWGSEVDKVVEQYRPGL